MDPSVFLIKGSFRVAKKPLSALTKSVESAKGNDSMIALCEFKTLVDVGDAVSIGAFLQAEIIMNAKNKSLDMEWWY